MKNLFPSLLIIGLFGAYIYATPKAEPIVDVIESKQCDVVCACDELKARVAALEAKVEALKACDCEHAKESHVVKQAEKVTTNTSPQAASAAVVETRCENGQCYRVQPYSYQYSQPVRRLFGRW